MRAFKRAGSSTMLLFGITGDEQTSYQHPRAHPTGAATCRRTAATCPQPAESNMVMSPRGHSHERRQPTHSRLCLTRSRPARKAVFSPQYQGERQRPAARHFMSKRRRSHSREVLAQQPVHVLRSPRVSLLRSRPPARPHSTRLREARRARARRARTRRATPECSVDVQLGCCEYRL